MRKLRQQPRLYAAVFGVVVASAPIAAHAMGDEEFVGPFPSWANVKTQYGAKGDGVSDDTAAIQKALSALGPNNPTLYLPAGTYRITQTLRQAAQQHVSIIGQDPSNTTLLWAGSSGGTMLHLNGVAYSRFNRLTLNGQGNAAVAIDQSWDNKPPGYFDTGNEYADDVFENTTTVAFRCGGLGVGCAETSMLRDRFINNYYGVSMGNYNALDMFIWHSLFQNNAVGAGNYLGAGNFHVYNSIFQNNGSPAYGGDIAIGNTGTFNFRNNYSIGSQLFLYAGSTGNPANITVEGNTILDTAQSRSIWVGNLGPLVLIDNTIRSGAAVTSGPVVYAAYLPNIDVFSMGNTFTAGSGSCASTAPVYGSGHCHEINDQVVARSTINPPMPILPGTPPNNNRQIFEASPAGSGTACTAAAPCSVQQAITKAANAEQSGAIRPVVHIAARTYNITATITVPATVNSGIQIIGDGGYSQLTWAGSGAGPVMRLLGPSKVILRDFAVNGASNSANGIEVDNADQPGSRVFMEQVNLSESRRNHLLVDGLDYTNVELHDFYHQYGSTTGMTSVNVTGGPSATAGLWQGGATNIFAGASAGNDTSYAVSNGAHVGMRDIWYDAGAGGNLVANVTGTGSFTYAGAALYLAGSEPRAISLDNFQGTAALLNLITNGNIEISGNGANAQVLSLGLVGPSATFFRNSSSPAATAAFLNGQTTAHPPSGARSSALPEQGTVELPFLTATLDQMRTMQPTVLAPLASGVTDLRFYRLFVHSALTGIHLGR